MNVRFAPRRPIRLRMLAAICSLAVFASVAATFADRASAAPTGFEEVTAFSGLELPTVVRFSPDGRVFIAEKSGLIKVFSGPTDPTPEVFADLRTEVHNFWDRGLLGLALHPNFPANPSVYALYTHDAVIGGTAPRWGAAGSTFDDCPTPPGANNSGCVVSGRLVKLVASGNQASSKQVLIEDWCAQFPSHTIGALEFGLDGMLYVSGGDGASFNYADWGQAGNPCGDPGGANPSPPTAEGGALRSQDLRTSGDPVGLDGTILRLDPETGAGAPGNPMAESADPNTRRIVSYGDRNPFRMTVRPGTNEVWTSNVGWGGFEEINRLANPTAARPTNFGWPCYEGVGRQGSYDTANLSICENLYAEGPAAVTAPYFTYQHGSTIGGATNCRGSSSITGLAFAPPSNNYPAGFGPGALYFADYSRGCIFVIPPGANGLPDTTRVQAFIAPAAGPVNLTFGPDGDLYYVDIEQGRIQRMRYNPGTTPLDPGPVTPAECPVGQFSAQYFSGISLMGQPILNRCETTVNNNWAGGSPGSGVPNDQFSARWTTKAGFANAGEYEFTVRADDGVRLFVDNTLVIDKFVPQAATTYKARLMLTAGVHDVRMEYYESGGNAEARLSWLAVDGANPTPPPAGECAVGQYRADYFQGITLSGASLLSRCEAEINNNWGTGGPGVPVGNDWFSARWTSKQSFPANGNYEFTTTTDDGVRLYVDNVLKIDKFVNQPATTHKATVPLTAGLHDIRLEYYESGADAVAKLTWATVGGPPAMGVPVPSVSVEAPDVNWSVDDTIYFSGSATDAEDGVLPASRLSWALVLQHCPSSCHAHTISAFVGVGEGAFVTPDHEYPSHLELQLTATDSNGNKSTITRVLQPKVTQLSVASDPVGAPIAVGDTATNTPFNRTVIQKSTNGVSAPATFVTGGNTYEFVSWSDGGARSHVVVAQPAAATLTAKYALVAGTAPESACPAGQFQAEYFTGKQLAGAPLLSRCETSVNNDWGGGGPGGGVGTDNFSARWRTTMDLASPGSFDFTTIADDGVRLYVDDVLVIDKFVDQAPSTYRTTVDLTAGKHLVRMDYYEAYGGAVAKLSWVASAIQPPPNADGSCAADQFTAAYFQGVALGGSPVLTRCETTLNNDWGGGSPGGGVPTDMFSARWVTSPTLASGTYRFTVTADDGVRLYIDNVLVIDKFIDQAPRTYNADRALSAGVHSIRVEYYERGGGAVAKASWVKL